MVTQDGRRNMPWSWGQLPTGRTVPSGQELLEASSLAKMHDPGMSVVADPCMQMVPAGIKQEISAETKGMHHMRKPV